MCWCYICGYKAEDEHGRPAYETESLVLCADCARRHLGLKTEDLGLDPAWKKGEGNE